MIERIDSFLNWITMYRLTLYYLIALVSAAVILSIFGILPYNFFDILINVCLAVASCIIANYIFAKLFHAISNPDSVLITALILVLLIPVKFPANGTFIIITSIIAMGSKYLLTI